MKNIIFNLIATFAILAPTISLSAEHLYQCAPDEVGGQFRVNVIVPNENGVIRANLTQGRTLGANTIYHLVKTDKGYSGTILGKPQFTMKLFISTSRARNSNIDGYVSTLDVVYPDLNARLGYNQAHVDFICGKKISHRFN